jgi:hypothetical protein
MDSNEEGQVIWPKASQRQRLYINGTREEQDLALLPCHGACSKQQLKWTWHSPVHSPTYKCNDCQNQRRWGFRYSF